MKSLSVFNSVSRTSIEDVEVLGVRLTVVEQIKIVEIIADNLEAFELSEAVTFHGEKEADISETLTMKCTRWEIKDVSDSS